MLHERTQDCSAHIQPWVKTKTDGGLKIRCGYGRCTHKDCNCPAWENDPGNPLCGNCGHRYEDHALV